MGIQWKQCLTLFFGAPKADGDCSHEIKRCLLLGRKVMTNLGSILKSRDIISPTKVQLVKAMVFPVVMYGCESWTIRKAEHQKLMLWTVVLEKTLENLLDCKSVNPKGNQLWILTGSLMLKMKLQYFGHLMRRDNWFGKDPDAGKDWGQEEKGGNREWHGCLASPTQWTWVWANSGS